MNYALFLADALVRKFVPTPLRFAVARIRFFAKHPQSTNHAGNAAIEIIKRDGVYIWRQYINRDDALSLADKALPLLQRVRDREKFSTQTMNDQESGLYRLKDADNYIPETKPIFDDPALMDIARAVTTPNVRAHMRMIELREGIYSASSEDCWHFDEPFKYKFKFFLLLTDVGPDNSPFSYCKGSHIFGRWRRPKEMDAFKYGYDGNWGFFHQHEFAAILKRYGKDWQPTICTGQAGDMILFDANGLHRRELLRSGYRIIMSNYYQA